MSVSEQTADGHFIISSGACLVLIEVYALECHSYKAFGL